MAVVTEKATNIKVSGASSVFPFVEKRVTNNVGFFISRRLINRFRRLKDG